jgi:hypothetical protein
MFKKKKVTLLILKLRNSGLLWALCEAVHVRMVYVGVYVYVVLDVSKPTKTSYI